MLPVEQLQSEVERALGADVMHLTVERGEVSVLVPRTRIADVLRILRDDASLALSQLIDICGVDYPDRPERFDVVYHLLGMRHNVRLRVKIETDERTPVPTVVGIHSGAGWFERECWDLFGVTFAGNPDLRRILTDYGFEGHPLRKDFPLTGYTEVRYDPEQKRVIYEPVKLPQDFRSFDFMSPWEGMTDINWRPTTLPGDEKAAAPAPEVKK